MHKEIISVKLIIYLLILTFINFIFIFLYNYFILKAQYIISPIFIFIFLLISMITNFNILKRRVINKGISLLKFSIIVFGMIFLPFIIAFIIWFMYGNITENSYLGRPITNKELFSFEFWILGLALAFLWGLVSALLNGLIVMGFSIIIYILRKIILNKQNKKLEQGSENNIK